MSLSFFNGIINISIRCSTVLNILNLLIATRIRLATQPVPPEEVLEEQMNGEAPLFTSRAPWKQCRSIPGGVLSIPVPLLQVKHFVT